jgi:hypothetical protein
MRDEDRNDQLQYEYDVEQSDNGYDEYENNSYDFADDEGCGDDADDGYSSDDDYPDDSYYEDDGYQESNNALVPVYQDQTILPPAPTPRTYAPASPEPVRVEIIVRVEHGAAPSPVYDLQRENALTLRRWFTNLLGELSEVYSMIFAKTDSIFQTHRYSVDDIVNHHAIQKCTATIANLEYNMQSWRRYDAHDHILLDEFERGRRSVMEEVNRILFLVCQRRPTFWENIRDTLLRVFARFTLQLIGGTLPRLTGW